MAHTPVLLKEVLHYLTPTKGDVVIDATLGSGGHSRAMLGAIGSTGNLFGIDADEENIKNLELEFQEPSVKLISGNFSDLSRIAEENNIYHADVILFDLGLSSMQLDNADRGFSFQKPGPLDMRFNQREGRTAADLVNKLPEKEISLLIKNYGEERNATRIARAIVETRSFAPITTTSELFELIKKSLPQIVRFKAGDVARRTFQALRIAVNDELQSLERGLKDAFDLLNPGGRMGVISFHSLEDRIVKDYFKSLARDCVCPPEFPVCRCNSKAQAAILTRKPITPATEEQEKNPRSRSAKFRAIKKLELELRSKQK